MSESIINNALGMLSKLVASREERDHKLLDAELKDPEAFERHERNMRRVETVKCSDGVTFYQRADGQFVTDASGDTLLVSSGGIPLRGRVEDLRNDHPYLFTKKGWFW